MTHRQPARVEEFTIPEQTLRGSRGEMVAAIDEAIVGLLALRHVVSGEVPDPERLVAASPGSRRRPARWSKFLAVVRQLAIGR
jgi:hypothetical protein